jgi:hypothetical protein
MIDGKALAAQIKAFCAGICGAGQITGGVTAA